MARDVDWDAAERLGVVLPISDHDYINMSSDPLHISGAIHEVDLSRFPFSQIVGRSLMDETNSVQDAAKELLQTYGEKAALVANDKATLASYARNEVRRDFWVAVFSEIRRTHLVRTPVAKKERV